MENNFEPLKLENQLCFPLYAASRELVKLYRPYLDEHNLTYTQYITMMVLWEENRCSVKELGAKLYLDSGTLTPVLKSLEQKGLLSRFRSESDERVLIAKLTEKGKELKNRVEDIPVKIGCMNLLSPEEGAALYTLLYALLGKIKDNN
ncbi:MAG TPA: MarR family transcriptional regulator [Ruminococcaceae bacterium]|nr:MarR family transcriptional regulator [Oscillospiraceae bacterium]